MTYKIRWFTFLFCCVLFGTGTGFAQNDDLVTIKGRIVEQNGGQPIPFATVLVSDNKTKKPITGGTTDDDGRFSLETEAGDFYIEISFMGFETKTFGQPISSNGVVNLGTVVLSEDAHQLSEVVVEGEVSTTEFKLDRRVFN